VTAVLSFLISSVWLIVLVAIAIGAFFLIKSDLHSFDRLKTTPHYRLAVETVKNNGQAREKLGENIAPGWWVNGKTKSKGDKEKARISLPISGSSGGGNVYYRAVRKSGEEWELRRLVLALNSSDTLVLIGIEPEEAEDDDMLSSSF